MRIRLDIAYDGTDFHGWAVQAGLRTVQGELELWLGRLLGEPITLTVAGRTDAGVHARGQVAHFDTAVPLSELFPRNESLLGSATSATRSQPANPALALASAAKADCSSYGKADFAPALAHRLGRVLPEDVIVRRVSVAPAGFDARFSAIWRRYCYRLCDGLLEPLARNYAVKVKYPLDLAAANSAAQGLLGLHDFAAFCKPRAGATTIRELRLLKLNQVGGLVEVDVRADAFAHSMVRSLVGALVEVGSGRRDANWLAGMLDRDERCGEITVMPAKGLTLEEVGYPPDAELAVRAAQARNLRELSDTAEPGTAEPDGGESNG
ncbi:MAG: tRNA pseudouridine(38-40) synthase TruA [Propionibacteriaceae bacterium]|nr:tRNA pseudouridine(38-40) synthase TruA [Propionibacteriaceae bacterium]